MPEQTTSSTLARRLFLPRFFPTANAQATLPETVPSSLTTGKIWCLLLALLLFEGIVFHQAIERDITWAHPGTMDQTGYLSASYENYEYSRDQGLGATLIRGLRAPAATGIMLPLQGTLIFSILGPSRHSALMLNFLYFAGLQLALFWTCRWGSQRWWPGFVALGLLLAVHSPWFYCGGLTDFRIDFIAMCLYGLTLCAILRSNLFASYRWAAAAGATATMLVMFRFLTSVYLFGLGFSLLAYLLVGWWMARHNVELRALFKRRLRGAALAACVLCVIAVPLLWKNRAAINGYYVQNHLVGNEKTLRAEEQLIHSPLDHWKFYPLSLATDHLGTTFLWLTGGMLVVAFGAYCWRRREPASTGVPFVGLSGGVWLCGTAIGFPLLVLSLNEAKSPIVVNITVLPLVALLALLIRQGIGSSEHRRWLGRTLAVVAMLVGLGQLISSANAHLHGFEHEDQRRLLAVHDQMIDDVVRKKIDEPQVGYNLVADHLNVGTLGVLAYERRSARIRAKFELSSLFEQDATTFLDRMDSCQMVVLMSQTPRTDFEYPGNRQMREHYPEMLHHCQTMPHFYPIAHERLTTGEEIHVFGRHSLRLDTHKEHHWLTTRGIDLHDDRSALQHCPQVRMEGTTPFGSFSVRRVEVRSGKETLQTLTPQPKMNGARYVLEFEIDATLVKDRKEVSLHLEFDRPEVPERVPSWCKERGHRIAMVSPIVMVQVPAAKR